MSALVLALAVSSLHLPDTRVDVTVAAAKPATIFSSLAAAAGRPIDAGCAGDARVALAAPAIPLPVLFDLLSAKLDVSFEDAGDSIRVVCRATKPVRTLPGAELADLPADVREWLGTGDAGVLVRAVEPGSPAALIGLRENDVVTAIDGAPVATAAALTKNLLSRPGPRVQATFALLRGAERWQLALDLVRGGGTKASSAALMLRNRTQLENQQIMEMDGGEMLPTMLNESANDMMPDPAAGGFPPL